MQKDSKAKKWIAFIVLTITAGLIYRVPYIKTVFYDPLVAAFGITNVEVAKLMSTYSLSKTILYIPAGILVDRFDNRKMLVFSMAMLAVITFIYALIPSMTVMYVLYFFMAVSNVIFWVAFVKAVRMFGSEKEQGSVFGYSEGIRAAASLVINFIALAIYAKISATSGTPLSGVLILYGVVYVLMGIGIFFLIPSGTGASDGRRTTFKDYLDVLKVPSVWLVSLLVMCCYSVQVASEYTTPYLSNVMMMSVAVAGIVATIRSYGIGLFAAPIIGKITDKVKVPYSISVIVLLCAEIVMTVVLLLTPGDPSYVILCVVIVLAFAAAMYALRGVYYATMGEAGVPVALTGTATGIISVIGYLPDTFMNLLIGDKLDKYPGAAGYKYIFIYMIVFAVLGIVVAFIINRIGKKAAAAVDAEPKKA